jgi:hypothetical protein
MHSRCVKHMQCQCLWCHAQVLVAVTPGVLHVHRQRPLCRVLFVGHSAKTLSCAIWYSAKKSSFFAECLDHSTRQRRLYRFPRCPSLPSAMVIALGKDTLCRVLHSTKWPGSPFFICFCCSIQKNKRYISFTSHYISFASQNQHIYHQHHIYHKYQYRN